MTRKLDCRSELRTSKLNGPAGAVEASITPSSRFESYFCWDCVEEINTPNSLPIDPGLRGRRYRLNNLASRPMGLNKMKGMIALDLSFILIQNRSRRTRNGYVGTYLVIYGNRNA